MAKVAWRGGQSEQRFMHDAIERAVEQREAEARARKAMREQNQKLRALGLPVGEKKPPPAPGLGLGEPEPEPPAPVEPQGPAVINVDGAEAARLAVWIADGNCEIRGHAAVDILRTSSSTDAERLDRPEEPRSVLSGMLRGATRLDLGLLG